MEGMETDARIKQCLQLGLRNAHQGDKLHPLPTPAPLPPHRLRWSSRVTFQGLKNNLCNGK